MKKSSNTAAVVRELAKPIADELNLIIWDVQFAKEGSDWVLRVVIDKEGGVSISDCENMSRPLDKKLDEADPIEQSYCLEVSSAGPERELTQDWHYQAMQGNKITVKLIRPYNGIREFVGTLVKHESESVFIEAADGSYQFKDSEIAYVRLYMEF